MQSSKTSMVESSPTVTLASGQSSLEMCVTKVG